MTEGGTLTELARKYGTDKVAVHSYTEHYDRHFADRRLQPISLLEIGVGGEENPAVGGESLRMWKEYFPLAQIVGVDVYDKRHFSEDRITVLQGDQSDAAFLRSVGARYGAFDIIIDDGSHYCRHVISSFKTLFPFLVDNGLYAIEDVQTSYWGEKGGSSKKNRRGTTMSFLKDLADGLNYAEFDIPRYRPTNLDQSIVAITFYHNLVLITKGANTEASNVLPPHPRTGRLKGSLEGLQVARAVRIRAERDDAIGRFLARFVKRPSSPPDVIGVP